MPKLIGIITGRFGYHLIRLSAKQATNFRISGRCSKMFRGHIGVPYLMPPRVCRGELCKKFLIASLIVSVKSWATERSDVEKLKRFDWIVSIPSRKRKSIFTHHFHRFPDVRGRTVAIGNRRHVG